MTLPWTQIDLAIFEAELAVEFLPRPPHPAVGCSCCRCSAAVAMAFVVVVVGVLKRTTLSGRQGRLSDGV